MYEGVRSSRGRRPLAILSLVAVAAIWGVTFPIVRGAVSTLPPLQFLMIRFLIASAVLLPLVWRRDGLRAIWDRSVIPLGVCLAVGYWLQTEGLRTVNSSVSAFLTGTSVVLVPIVGRAIGWERPGGRGWGAVFIAMGGIYLLEGRLPDRWSAGETMTIGCAIAFALQILLVGRAMKRQSKALPLGAGQILVATLIFCGAAALHDGPTPMGGISRGAVFAAILTGLLATAAAFVIQMKAQEFIEARHAAICFASEPLFAAIFATSFFRESMTPRGWLGAAAIVAAIVLVSTEIRQEQGPPLVEGSTGVC